MGRPEALLLTPGSGGTSEHATLQAIEAELAPMPVRRHDFAYRRAGKKSPPRAPKLIEELTADLPVIADELGVDVTKMVVGGRSMGGRICSMAAAEGLAVSGLVLLSYPLHPPGKPDRLRVEHFPAIDVPCLFISGDNDPFGTPDEFEEHLGSIAGDVQAVFLDGGRHDPKNKAQTAEIVRLTAEWVDSL